jgi:hypothetical protein
VTRVCPLNPSGPHRAMSDGFCIGATMTEVTKDETGLYQARKK